MWRPGMSHYPFRLYLQGLHGWLRTTGTPAELVGHRIVDRLEGEAFEIATSLQLRR